MPKIPGIGQRDAVRVLSSIGFRIIRQGKHIVMSNGMARVEIPRHTAINAYTMGNIAQHANLTPEQFRELL